MLGSVAKLRANQDLFPLQIFLNFENKFFFGGNEIYFLLIYFLFSPILNFITVFMSLRKRRKEFKTYASKSCDKKNLLVFIRLKREF